MGQPTILRASGRAIAKFGNLPLPNGQGTLGWINLNDGVNTGLNVPGLDDDSRQIGLTQLLYRGDSTYLSDDWGPAAYALPLVYVEDASHFAGDLLARLAMAGEQMLTFDALTCALVKYRRTSGRTLDDMIPPLASEFVVEFQAANRFWRDISASSLGATALATDSGSTFSVTYAGSVWCSPVWTLDVPVGNGVAINSFQLRSTMWGDGDARNEALTVNFLSRAALAASTHWVITIDSAACTATDQNGNGYDVSGSFPKLYGPAGHANPFKTVVTPASGSSTGLTIAASYYPRWML